MLFLKIHALEMRYYRFGKQPAMQVNITFQSSAHLNVGNVKGCIIRIYHIKGADILLEHQPFE